MQCPGCATRLTWRSSVLRKATCPGCGNRVGYKAGFSATCALAGLLVSAIMSAGFIQEGLVVAGVAVAIILVASPRHFRLLDNKPTKPDA